MPDPKRCPHCGNVYVERRASSYRHFNEMVGDDYWCRSTSENRRIREMKSAPPRKPADCWLIEFAGHGTVLWWSPSGLCGNAMHATRFASSREAHAKLADLFTRGEIKALENYIVTEHRFVDSGGKS